MECIVPHGMSLNHSCSSCGSRTLAKKIAERVLERKEKADSNETIFSIQNSSCKYELSVAVTKWIKQHGEWN